MFGILLSLFNAGVAGVDYATRTHAAKKRGWDRMEKGENKYGTYFDINGQERDLVTGQVKRLTRDNQGYLVQTDMYGHTIRDITVEEEKADFQKAVQTAKQQDSIVFF